MSKRNILIGLMLSAGLVHAGDKLKGNTLIRSLKAGEGSLLLFQNPTSEPAATLVNCVYSADVAKEILSDDQMGGMVVVSGSTMVVKKGCLE